MAFTAIGLPLACAVAPSQIPPLALAPTLGWVAFAAIGLPVLTATGFTPVTVTLFSIGAGAASWLLHRLGKARAPDPARRLKPAFCLVAGALALLPLMAIMPKHVAGGILLAPPLFDHVKIAVVDAILRDGLPVPNPFIGPASPGHLAYYYLWHVSTAMLAGTAHVGGWAAEAAMTGFTAYASLLLIMGLVLAAGGRSASVVSAMLLILPGSVRPILQTLAGKDTAGSLIPGNADIGAWLNQSAWVPQHLASACCVVVSALLMLRLAQAGNLLVAATLGLCVAAGFESSIWAGGIAFAASGGAWAIILLARSAQAARGRFLLLAMGAALLTACLILPLLSAELHAIQSRQAGGGIEFAAYQTFGTFMPNPWRRLADIPGFWLVLLPFSLPAVMPLGLAWLWLARKHLARSLLLQGFMTVILACLATVWLFRSTIDNNDLGWRAALPAILLLTACAGRAVGSLIETRNWSFAALAIALAALGVPDAVRMTSNYVIGQLPGDASGFARSEALWQAVRRYAGPDDRIASNPLAVALATPWPVNIGWATLSDRPSCYAGRSTVIAYGTLPRSELSRLSGQFKRVFGGQAERMDVEALARAQNCAFAVITPNDGAWSNDPFAASSDYSVAEAAPAWRIYRRTSP